LKYIKVDLREDRLTKLERRLNRKKVNPVFLGFICVVVLLSVLGIRLTSGIKTKPKKRIKIPTKIEIIDLSKVEVQAEKHLKSSKTSKIKSTAKPTGSEKTVEKRNANKITINRVVVYETQDYQKALRYKRFIKTRFKDTDPWILRKEDTYYVIAGSYSNESNVKSVLKELKELGLKPRIWRIEVKR